jgi:hypothetical protein
MAIGWPGAAVDAFPLPGVLRCGLRVGDFVTVGGVTGTVKELACSALPWYADIVSPRSATTRSWT